jgi:trehalose synthase
MVGSSCLNKPANNGHGSTVTGGDMNRVPTCETRLDEYKGIVCDKLFSEIKQLAEGLRGIRIIHVSAASKGDSAAEILKSLTPLMCDVGIDAKWYALSPDPTFFRINKRLHHCLYGSSSLSAADFSLYLANNEKAAVSLTSMGIDADLWLFHGVQVLPMLSFMDSCTGIWVNHVNTTRPNEKVKDMLLPYMSNYRKIVTSMPEYFPDGDSPTDVAVFPPAIDPLQPRHKPMQFSEARELLAGLGMDTNRPIICQVSVFDYWRDPWSVIDAYQLARKKVSGIQLALVDMGTSRNGSGAADILESVRVYTADDRDIHIFSRAQQIGDLEINAFQSGSDIILHKSTYDSFGLNVTEAMWKARPVISGTCGGIQSQIRDGVTGFLCEDVESCAQKIVTLLKDQTLGVLMGDVAREWVRKHYLMPRLLRDYLRLASAVLEEKEKAYAALSH